MTAQPKPLTMSAKRLHEISCVLEDAQATDSGVDAHSFACVWDEMDATRTLLAERDERIKELEHFLSTARGAANELWSRAESAESRIADLKHQLGEYADKLDCMVDPEEHRQKLAELESALCVERQAANHWMGEATKAHNDGCHVADEMRIALAASKAECAELREALVPFSKCPHWGNHPMSMPEPCDNCTAAMLLSRPTGTKDALRAVCEKVWDAACESVQKVERAYASGQMWLITKEETRAADLARVLGEVANG